MPKKLPEKIEDWTPPWADGEFNEDKARGLIFNLSRNLETAKESTAAARRERDEARTSLTEFQASHGDKPKDETDKDRRITELTTELAKLKKDGRAEDRSLIDRYEVALEVGGLSLSDAKRLVGDDHDSLVDDARDLADRLAPKGGEGEGEGGAGKPPAPSNRPLPKRRDLGNGRDRQGEQPDVVSVDDLIKASVTAPNLGGAGLKLAQLTR